MIYSHQPFTDFTISFPSVRINISFTSVRINLSAKFLLMPLPLMPQQRKKRMPSQWLTSSRRSMPSQWPVPSRWWAPALVAGALFTGCSHKMAPEGHYQETPIIADGNVNDWSLPLRFSNASYTLQYNITNDKKNLYICILSRDEATQLRMLRAGMNVYLDPKGEKSKKTGIAFPIRQQPDPENYRSRNGNPITGTDNKSRKEQLLLQSDYYNATGFLNIENGQFGLADTKSPIRVAMKLNNNDSLLVYEAIVPLKNIIGADLGPRSDRTNFSVGIILNAVPGQGGGNGGGGPRPSFGGGGMRMGGMRGGMGGGRRYGSSGNSQGAKEEENWYQFGLTAK